MSSNPAHSDGPPRASERSADLPAAVDDVLAARPRSATPQRAGTARPVRRFARARVPDAARGCPGRRVSTGPANADGISDALGRSGSHASSVHAGARRSRPILLGFAAAAVGLIVGLTLLNGDGGGQDAPTAGRRPDRSGAARRQPRRRQHKPAPKRPSRAGHRRVGTGGSTTGLPADERRPLRRGDPGAAARRRRFPEGSSDLPRLRALQPRPLAAARRAARTRRSPYLEQRLRFNNQRGVVKKELAAARRAAGGGRAVRRRRRRGEGGGEERLPTAAIAARRPRLVLQHQPEEPLRALLARVVDHALRRPCSTTTPSSMNTTRSATSRAKPISWVTTTIVMPSRGQLAHHVEHLLDQLGVERAGDLVEQHHVRVHRQRPRDRDALLLAARQPLGVLERACRRARPARAARGSWRPPPPWGGPAPCAARSTRCAARSCAGTG